MPTRRLTVGAFHYELLPLKDDPPGSRPRPRRAPWLQLRGQWLAQAGFSIDTPVSVRVSRGRLVITVAGR
jgi:hypothetical protein